MRIRFVVAVGLLSLTMGAAGCSSSTPSTTAGGDVTTTKAGAPSVPAAPDVDLSSVSTIAAKDCVTVTKGKLDILIAKDAAEAKAAGDALKTANPPAAIAADIDVLVGLKGDTVAITSGAGKGAKTAVDAWVLKLCPKK